MASPELQFLALEVQEIIIDFLHHRPQPEQLTQDEYDAKEARDGWESTPVQERLRWLPDLLNLSRTCKWFRNLLAPRIFETVYLQNTTKSAMSMKALVEGGHARYVKEMCYVGVCQEDQQEGPLRHVYPAEVEDVLSNMTSLFPRLEKLSVSFPFNYECDMMIDYFQDYEFNTSYEDALADESENAWRGLMAQSFRAILRNFNSASQDDSSDRGRIRSFDIQDLNVVPVSTFHTKELHDFLSLLTEFKLSLTRYDNGVGWAINSYNVFHGLPASLPSWFFNHLSSVEAFTFDPRDTAVLGGGGTSCQIDLPLKQVMMPKLRTLSLHHIFICNDLIDFITRHYSTLESITLGNCFGPHPSTDDEDPILWHEFFDALVGASPPLDKLTSFETSFDQDDKEWLLGLKSDWIQLEDPELVARVRAKWEAEPDSWWFVYGEQDGKYGFTCCEQVAIQEAFLRGRDHDSYVKLLAFVASNVRGA